MQLVDSHCHLYLEEFRNDLPKVIARANDAGVSRFFLPGIDSAVIDDMMKLEQEWPGQIFPMMGLHPCSVKENYADELNIVKHWLEQRQFVAIGEIGLDFYWDTTFTTQQYDAFKQQMEWALLYELPIVIHTRNAMQETIETVRPYAESGLRGIFHCFGDSIETAQQIIEMNFLLGIGGVLTYKKSGLAEVMEHISLEHIVLETDAPYLTPVPFRGKRNESSYIRIIAEKLAEIKKVTMEEVAMITTANADKLFGTKKASL
jgi:TatD DNase family protein